MINNKKILAVVLARKGSVGLPGKNYKSLSNLPCFLWSVLAAENSKYVDLIAVSSLCPDVKKAWQDYNKSDKCIFIDRPEELNGPLVRNEAVVRHAVEECRNNLKFRAELIVTLQPTSPFRYDNLLDSCIEKLEEDKSNSLLTVTRHHPFIWHNTLSGPICPNNYYLNRPMRQELQESDFIFLDNGNIYITDHDTLITENNRLGGKVSLYETDKYQGLQIDDMEDFELIERIIEIKNRII